jgi:hypothetical protein
MTTPKISIDKTSVQEKPALPDIPVKSSDTGGSKPDDEALDKVVGGKLYEAACKGTHMPEIVIE